MILYQNENNEWVKAEPLGWAEEHDWLQRIIFWIIRKPHCSEEAS